MEVLERNWRCRRGELDLVANDGAALVLVEVKTRRRTGYGDPAEAVDARQAAPDAAAGPAAGSPSNERSEEVRFDVVGVLRPPAGPARVEALGRGVLDGAART